MTTPENKNVKETKNRNTDQKVLGYSFWYTLSFIVYTFIHVNTEQNYKINLYKITT